MCVLKVEGYAYSEERGGGGGGGVACNITLVGRAGRETVDYMFRTVLGLDTELDFPTPHSTSLPFPPLFPPCQASNSSIFTILLISVR